MPVTYSPCPRPILKRPSPPGASVARPPTPRDEPQQLLAIDPSVLQPLVHFPPKPALVSSTHTAYSSSAYDRSPIVVLPNQCALPARGCPGRTYTLGDAASYAHERARQKYVAAQKEHARERQRGKHLHSRAGPSYDECGSSDDGEATPIASPLQQVPVLPPLVPDLSSESEESDGFTSPPPEFARIAAASAASLSIPHVIGKSDLASSLSSIHISATSPISSTTPTPTSARPLLPHSPSSRRASHSPRRATSPRRRSSNARSPSRGPDSVRGHRISSASPVRYKTFGEGNAFGLNGFGISVHEAGCLDGF